MNEISMMENRQNAVYIPVSGMIESIQPMDGFGQPSGCYQIVTLRKGTGEEPDLMEQSADEESMEENQDLPAVMPAEEQVCLVIGPDTCFVNGIRLYEGMNITAFYDGNAPTLLIYPPQYRAVVVTEQVPGQNVMMARFNGSLTALDRSLKLNLDESVDIINENGQNFYGSLAGHILVVVYGAATRSIPPQTTPYQVIVMCRE